jgi:hypothetical protein
MACLGPPHLLAESRIRHLLRNEIPLQGRSLVTGRCRRTHTSQLLLGEQQKPAGADEDRHQDQLADGLDGYEPA